MHKQAVMVIVLCSSIAGKLLLHKTVQAQHEALQLKPKIFFRSAPFCNSIFMYGARVF
jgi:hypothetical protein